MAKFKALELALALAAALGPLLAQVARHDRGLATQMRDASAASAACRAEGAQRAGRDRLHLYRVAGGSAAEVRTQLLLAVAWGYLGAEAVAPVVDLADQLVAVTWRLTNPR